MVRVAKTIFPLDWDIKCTDKSFNEWQVYIKEELKRMSYPNLPNSDVEVKRMSQEDAMGQMRILLEAKKILR